MVKASTPEQRARVCIVIPVCNEEGSFAILSEKLKELHRTLERQYQLEYCIVDDGSTDRTPLLARSVAPSSSKCTVLSHVRNLGVGAAFRTGCAHVSADIVCTIDADCSYAPAELQKLLEPIARDEADVVVASPYHPSGAVEGVQQWRLLLSLQCSRLYRAVSPLKLHTYTSIFRAYRGSIVKTLGFPSDGFVSAVEILMSAAAQGYRVSEVPATLTKRVAGYSKMRLVRTVQSHAHLLSRCMKASLSGSYPHMVAPSSVRPNAIMVIRHPSASTAAPPTTPATLALKKPSTGRNGSDTQMPRPARAAQA
jgi:dolichol-phosphate mannosyltransferase